MGDQYYLYCMAAPRAKQFSPSELEYFRYAEVTPSTVVLSEVSDADPFVPGYFWSDETGKTVFSNFFLAPSRPSRIFNVDLDHDEDIDVILQYEDGSTAVSYDVTSQLLSAKLAAQDEPNISEQLAFWLEDQFPGTAKCLAPQEQWTYVVAAAGILQMYKELSAYFSVMAIDNINIDPDVAKNGADRLIKKYTTEVAKALEDEKNDHDNDKKEEESCGPAFQEHIRLLTAIVNSIQDLSSSAYRTAKLIGVKDGGIGIGFDRGDPDDNFVEISTLLKDKPGEQAGLQIKDRIIEVDGISVAELKKAGTVLVDAGISDDQDHAFPVQNAIAGPLGSRAYLKVERGYQVLTFSIPRNFNLTPLRFDGIVP